MLSHETRERLKQYLMGLKERELQNEIVQFFAASDVRCQPIHGSGEHGSDLIAHMGADSDPLGSGYNILVQVKRGDVGQRDFHELLGQLVEATYYMYPQSPFDSHHARRVVLMCSGQILNEASESIQEFNKRLGIVIESFDINSLVELFDKQGYSNTILERITEVGTPSDEIPQQPTLGDSFDEDEF